MSETENNTKQLLMNRYPTEDMIVPVEAITELLTEAGHPEPTKWLKGLDIRATSPEVNQNVQRFLVNRYWRPVLGMVDEDTSVARYCLMDEGPMYTWLLLFKETVIPVIIKHNLPDLTW